MLLSAVSVLVVAQSSSEIPEGLMNNPVDATEWFIAIIKCSTCFGHFYAHHQELESMCVLLPPMVCDALFDGCRESGAGQQAILSG